MPKKDSRQIAGFIALLCAAAPAADSLEESERRGDMVIRYARDDPAADHEAVYWWGARWFVANEVFATARDVRSSAEADAGRIELALDPAVAERLIRFPPSRFAIYLDEKLIAIARVDTATTSGVVALSDIPPAALPALVAALASAPAPSPSEAAITLVPRRGMVRRAELLAVDVFISGVDGLRTYQVSLDAFSANQMMIPWEEIRIDSSRADFVFGSERVITACDQTGGRAGGLNFDATTDVRNQTYVATWFYRVPDAATGPLTFRVRPGSDSFLADIHNQTIPFTSGPVRVPVAVSYWSTLAK